MAKYSKVVLMKPDTLKITGYTNIQSAIDNSISGDTIFVYPSTYEEQITLKNGVDILCYAGVDITSNAVDATIIDGGVACVCKFVGDYTIHNTGGGVEFLFTNINTVVTRTVGFVYSAGNLALVTADYSLVGGSGSSTSSPYSTVLGVGNFIGTGSDGSVVVGLDNMITSGNYSFVQGRNNLIANQYADPTVTNHVEGISNTAFGNGGHAEGIANTTVGWCSHAEGDTNITYGAMSHAEGGFGTTVGFRSHSEGRGGTAYGWYAHAEGVYTVGLGYGAHAEGRSTMAGPDGNYMCSHAEGYVTTTYGQYAHSEGQGTSAIGIASHAEGLYARAIGAQSHAEGYYTTSIGDYSHSEGSSATSIGHRSHAEGSLTKAIGLYSHAEGELTTAIGASSHAEGAYTIASGSYSHVQGAYNTIDNNSYSFIIGNGTSNVSRSNLIYASGSRFDVYGTLYVSGSSQITRAIIQNLAVYADNTSAISGGLTTSGSMYRTSTGQLMVTY